MADARTQMLASVRKALGRATSPDPAEVAAEAAALSVDAAATQPALKHQDPLPEFIARVQGERLAATVERIPDDAAIPAAIARYLQAEGAPLSLALAPDAAM